MNSRMDKCTIIMVIIAICRVTEILAIDQGFELLFTSNTREYENLEVEITGKVPSWLKGRMIKNGLGKLEMGDRAFHHIFDGYAKLNSFTFNGSYVVNFTSKFVQTTSYKQSRKTDAIAPFVLFSRPDPPFNAIETAEQLINGIDNTNVNIHSFPVNSSTVAQQFVAVSDFWQSYQFDPVSLKTLAYINPKLPTSYALRDHVPLPSTSHAVKEYKANSYISFVSYMSPFPLAPNYINVIRITSTNERENIVSIKCNNVPYMHALALSKNYAIIFADPLYINKWKLLANVDPVNSLEWIPSEKTSVYVVDLHNKQVTKLKVAAKVHMHHVNSYERKGKIIIDYITYDNMKFVKSLTIQTLHNVTERNKINSSAKIMRYEINLANKSIKTRTFGKAKRKIYTNQLDFPAVNDEYKFKTYCFVYGIVMKSDNKHVSAVSLVKNDVCEKNRDRAWYRDNHFPSEPVFVSSPYRRSEDDGVLISLILNGHKKQTYVGIFDAKTMIMIGKGYLPDFIPFTLHGDFFK